MTRFYYFRKTSMDKTTRMYFFLIFNFLNLPKDETKTISGSIRTKEDWVFLTRFCFSKDDGSMDFKIIYNMNSTTQAENLKLLLYFDDQWPAVYGNDFKNCHQKQAVLKVENNQVIYLSSTEGWTHCNRTGTVVTCQAHRTFNTMRDRWWYIVASNCDTPGLLILDYKITMLNGADHSAHFSADEQTIFEFDVALLILIAILCCLSFYSSSKLQERRLFHLTYRLYLASLYIFFFSLLTFVVGYAQYSADGIDNAGKLIGRILEAISTLIFIMMLVLLGKGYTITRSRMSSFSWFVTGVFACCLVTTYTAVFIYQYNVFDPAQVIYLMESVPGYMLLALRLICWIFFTVSCVITIKHDNKKKGFYVFLLIVYSIWFVVGPIIVIVANTSIPAWMREKLANGIFGCLNFLAYVIMMYLTWPTNFHSYFPYHIKTNMVGNMTNEHLYITTDERLKEMFTSPSVTTAPPIHIPPLTRSSNLYPRLPPLPQTGIQPTPNMNIFTVSTKNPEQYRSIK